MDNVTKRKIVKNVQIVQKEQIDQNAQIVQK